MLGKGAQRRDSRQEGPQGLCDAVCIAGLPQPRPGQSSGWLLVKVLPQQVTGRIPTQHEEGLCSPPRAQSTGIQAGIPLVLYSGQSAKPPTSPSPSPCRRPEARQCGPERAGILSPSSGPAPRSGQGCGSTRQPWFPCVWGWGSTISGGHGTGALGAIPAGPLGAPVQQPQEAGGQGHSERQAPWVGWWVACGWTQREHRQARLVALALQPLGARAHAIPAGSLLFWTLMGNSELPPPHLLLLSGVWRGFVSIGNSAGAGVKPASLRATEAASSMRWGTTPETSRGSAEAGHGGGGLGTYPR